MIRLLVNRDRPVGPSEGQRINSSSHHFDYESPIARVLVFVDRRRAAAEITL